MTSARTKRGHPAWCLMCAIPRSVRTSLKCTRSADTPQRVKDQAIDRDETPPVAEIQLKNVSLSYDGNKVLSNLNLTINKGESTALIGTSGTGKSTTLRVISGLELPNSGDVILRGWKRKYLVSRQKSNLHLSMVFQGSALFDSMTVRENVGFRLQMHSKLSDERILELVKFYLQRVDMEDAIDKYPDQLSGGMRKRVSIARAIIYDPDNVSSAPDILLYDEPTAGLDPTASTRIENLICSVRDVCPTCIVVTHQFSTIRRVADRVVLMHKGQVAWDGKVDELDVTENPYVRQFMSASIEGPLSTID